MAGHKEKPSGGGQSDDSARTNNRADPGEHNASTMPPRAPMVAADGVRSSGGSGLERANARSSTASSAVARVSGHEQQRGDVLYSAAWRQQVSDDERGDVLYSNASRQQVSDDERGDVLYSNASRQQVSDDERGDVLYSNASRQQVSDDERGDVLYSNASRQQVSDDERGDVRSSAAARQQVSDDERGDVRSSAAARHLSVDQTNPTAAADDERGNLRSSTASRGLSVHHKKRGDVRSSAAARHLSVDQKNPPAGASLSDAVKLIQTSNGADQDGLALGKKKSSASTRVNDKLASATSTSVPMSQDGPGDMMRGAQTKTVQAARGQPMRRRVEDKVASGTSTSVPMNQGGRKASAQAESSSAARNKGAMKQGGAPKAPITLQTELASAHSSPSLAINSTPSDPLLIKKLRQQCRDIAQHVSTNSVSDQHVALAMSLATQYPEHSFTNTLAAAICFDVASSFGGQMFGNSTRDNREDHLIKLFDLAVHYSNLAEKFYKRAEYLAPNCISIPIGHCKAIVLSMNLANLKYRSCHIFGAADYGPAEEQIRRAIDNKEPDDPMLHSVFFDPHPRDRTRQRPSSSRSWRIQKARGEAREEQRRFEEMICKIYVPREVGCLWGSLGEGMDYSGRILSIAQRFYNLYPFCTRAHVLLIWAKLKLTESMDEEERKDEKKEILVELQLLLQSSAIKFPQSIVISLLSAEVNFMLEEYQAVVQICQHGLRLCNATDPWKEDVPVQSTEGGDLDARVFGIKHALQQLCIEATSRIQASVPSPSTPEEAKKSPIRNSKGSNYAFRYGYTKKKPRDPTQAPLVFDNIQVPERVPVTSPVHYVRGEFVPEDIVNLYKDYCSTLSTCSTTDTPCHLCCFEEAWCYVVPKYVEETHYHGRHKKEKKGEAIKCKELGCYARVRNMKDYHQHNYFVHRLPLKTRKMIPPEDWWKMK